MNKKNYLTTIGILGLLASIQTLSANIIWPGLFVAEAIYSTWFLIGISIIIEAASFYYILKDISPQKALAMSLIGNIASSVVGTALMALSMVGYHAIADRFVHGTFDPINQIVTVIAMFLGSCFIELLTLAPIFKRSFKELAIPVLVGNIITYAGTLVFMYMLGEVRL